MPSLILVMLEEGGTWSLTGVLFLLGFVISAFLVHYDVFLELEEKKQEIETLQNLKPVLELGLSEDGESSHGDLFITLKPVPIQPDYETLIAEKRKELLAKKSRPNSSTIGPLFTVLNAALRGVENLNYESEVEAYLIEYRDYLKQQFERLLVIDRLREIYPSIRNNGNATATSIIIELCFPSKCEQPTWEQEKHLIFMREQGAKEGLPPQEPNPYTILGMNLAPVNDKINLPLSFNDTSTPSRVRNVQGPQYSHDGINFTAKYTIAKLVPQQDETEFEPIKLWLGGIKATESWTIITKFYADQLPNRLDKRMTIKLLIDELPEKNTQYS
jgi:hypothetical protein